MAELAAVLKICVCEYLPNYYAIY